MSEVEKVASESTQEKVDEVVEEVAEEAVETTEEIFDDRDDAKAPPKDDDVARAERKEESKEKPKDEKEELNDKYMRLMAEYQNFRTRTAKEKQDIYAHANEMFALDILEVIDNFERAMANKPEDDKFADGIELILKQLLNVLEKNNVKEIEALGKPFDPNLHNAVMTEAAGEGKDAETVTQVLQKGYELNSKVIRAAMVAVAKE